MPKASLLGKQLGIVHNRFPNVLCYSIPSVDRVNAFQTSNLKLLIDYGP